jgi:hypothetical protein
LWLAASGLSNIKCLGHRAYAGRQIQFQVDVPIQLSNPCWLGRFTVSYATSGADRGWREAINVAAGGTVHVSRRSKTAKTDSGYQILGESHWL